MVVIWRIIYNILLLFLEHCEELTEKWCLWLRGEKHSVMKSKMLSGQKNERMFESLWDFFARKIHSKNIYVDLSS